MFLRNKKNKINYSEITPKQSFMDRRKIISSPSFFLSGYFGGKLFGNIANAESLGNKKNTLNYNRGYSVLNSDDVLNSKIDVTTYNNFYEFGTSKNDPSEKSQNFKPFPWTVDVGGLCLNPGEIDLRDYIKDIDLEERIYRLRCVEAWSMVIPWIGIPLSKIIKKFEPMGSAKYIQFETIYRPKEMPGQRSRRILPWPYIEGLRLDEAMNDLTFLAVGLYGELLPNQNGAPIRLVIPWKYGFKSIKSIVKITFTKEEPLNTWKRMAPREYGFFANVNPNVDHPRWSQSRERRIGEFFRRPTLMFNGYTEEVSHMYSGMNLNRYY